MKRRDFFKKMAAAFGVAMSGAATADGSMFTNGNFESWEDDGDFKITRCEPPKFSIDECGNVFKESSVAFEIKAITERIRKYLTADNLPPAFSVTPGWKRVCSSWTMKKNKDGTTGIEFVATDSPNRIEALK